MWSSYCWDSAHLAPWCHQGWVIPMQLFGPLCKCIPKWPFHISWETVQMWFLWSYLDTFLIRMAQLGSYPDQNMLVPMTPYRHLGSPHQVITPFGWAPNKCPVPGNAPCLAEHLPARICHELWPEGGHPKRSECVDAQIHCLVTSHEKWGESMTHVTCDLSWS